MADLNSVITNGNSMDTNGLESGYQTDEEDYEGKREDFLGRVFQLLLKDGVQKGTDPSTKVVEFLHPHELSGKMDLALTAKGSSDTRLIQLCRETIRYSVKTGHPHFFNQLYQGQDVYSLAGCWLTDTLNTSQYTFEVAPVFTMMEDVMLTKLRSVVGYLDGDGIFCPGGSVSNMYGLNLARFNKFPNIKTDGMFGLPRMCVYTSDQAHYSISKGAALLGIGVNNVFKVPCDELGKMIPAALDRMIQDAKDQGIVPLMVNGTGGTTVAGAYDPLNEIADVCQKHDVWFHVDMCWGGGAILSKSHRHLLAGIERTDSLSWNPHKMMGTQLQCCAFLTTHKGMLQQCHSANARYLFQQDKFYDVSFDTGDKSIQCGRKVDVFKLWLMWKARGDEGLEKGINNVFANAKYLTEKVKKTPGFKLVFPDPECTNVCFWYIPPSLRGMEETPEWWNKVAKVAPDIKERMVKKGSMLIGYNPMGSKVNFFRMVLANHMLTSADMDFCVEEIVRLGEDL